MATGNIGKIKASRVNNVPNVESYLGEKGILFYNYANGVIRMSDGITPGGVPIPYTVASVDTIGGIKAGPGANISTDGTLTIDTAGLPLSIGNLSFVDTTISTANANDDLYLESNGTGSVILVGNVRAFGTSANVQTDSAVFSINQDGQIQILVSATDGAGAVEIVGSTTDNVIEPGIPGTLLHITGQLDVPCRMYYDGNSDYVSMVARRWNGNVAVPTQVLVNEDVLRINSTAATDAGVGNVAMAQIRTTALENQTTTAQGSSITFTVTPVGSSAASRVDVANITVANGVTATKFTTSGNVTAGNITATNYTGKVTHSIRDAGIVTGTTLTLDVTTDSIVKCTFTDAFTVAFDNIIAGRIVTLIATNTSAGDTDIITAGISAVNMQGDSTLTVTQQTTAVITYYSLDGNVGSIYASAVYA